MSVESELTGHEKWRSFNVFGRVEGKWRKKFWIFGGGIGSHRFHSNGFYTHSTRRWGGQKSRDTFTSLSGKSVNQVQSPVFLLSAAWIHIKGTLEV